MSKITRRQPEGIPVYDRGEEVQWISHEEAVYQLERGLVIRCGSRRKLQAVCVIHAAEPSGAGILRFRAGQQTSYKDESKAWRHARSARLWNIAA